MPRLRRADCSAPGIVRRRRGRGFEYLNQEGRRADAETVERIRELVIPPAWADVWIFPYPNGHIQAVGTDAAGRRQYLYHPGWRRRRTARSSTRWCGSPARCPTCALRRRATCRRGLVRERVLACAVRLLERVA